MFSLRIHDCVSVGLLESHEDVEHLDLSDSADEHAILMCSGRGLTVQ